MLAEPYYLTRFDFIGRYKPININLLDHKIEEQLNADTNIHVSSTTAEKMESQNDKHNTNAPKRRVSLADVTLPHDGWEQSKGFTSTFPFPGQQYKFDCQITKEGDFHGFGVWFEIAFPCSSALTRDSCQLEINAETRHWLPQHYLFFHPENVPICVDNSHRIYGTLSCASRDWEQKEQLPKYETVTDEFNKTECSSECTESDSKSGSPANSVCDSGTIDKGREEIMPLDLMTANCLISQKKKKENLHLIQQWSIW